MKMNKNLYDINSDFTQKSQKALRQWLNYLIDAVFLAAFIIVNCGVLGVSFDNIIASASAAFLTFICAALMSNNEYNAGATLGKQTELYTNAKKQYAVKATLTGDEKGILEEFCQEFNEKTKRGIQEDILKAACISLKDFEETYEYADKNGELKTHTALKLLTKKELRLLYNKEICKIIFKAKKVKIHGLNKSELLDERTVEDKTFVGDDERILKTKTLAVDFIACAVIFVFNSVVTIGVGDGITVYTIGFLIYQCVYIISKALKARFQAYNNVTIDLVGRLTRQGDFLDMFRWWAAKTYPDIEHSLGKVEI